MTSILNDLEKVVSDYDEGRIDFYQYKSELVGRSNALNDFINFKYDLVMIIENWFEYVEFCYLEENWKMYSIELGHFLIDGIKCYPKEIQLPLNSDVVKEQFSRYLS
ncbi:hypothetical protein ABE427_00210 [Acinetobacter higginsii]|uniref:hypothetical protein n=1 Tax=Acinetobacter higginsii TaxID=70347 RepID=UPI003009376A